ncbi:KAP family NTPase, partial [Patescibacteria group bacterium]|nr:KAP family NTPase [Patescibacteria group bacterium]
MEKKKELNYIKDCEINLEESDLLSTRCYVNTILQIIENSDTPFTIGLFGGWGSGKSSIIKTLYEKLRGDQNSKAEIFIYDAWKYSKDSFRRTFILKLKERFKLDPTEELETFYKDKNEEIRGKTGLTDRWYLYLLIFIVPLVAINFKPFFIDKLFDFTTFIISLINSAIIFFITKTFVQYKISINKPKIFAPEEFENIFSEIVDKILNKERDIWVYIKNILGISKRLDKIVIVIDNIDRCHEDLAFELLLTIKNFLEKQGIIFIVPIDEDEMKRHLTTSGYDANEFLRKLFNTTLNIKKFSENDLYAFAKSLNNKHSLNLPENVISLVAQEFSKNPRRIIQFLNVLQTEILFSKKQEDSGNIPNAIISGNLPFLTKVLLIREEWFEFYRLLRKDPYLLEDINQSLKEGTKIEFVKIDGDQLRFLERTRHIETTNLEAFFVNKDVFSDIPDEINKLVISQDWEEIKAVLNKNKVSFEQFMQFVDTKFNEDVIGRNLIDTTGFNIFSLIFKIANDEDFSDNFKELYYTDSKNFGNMKSKLNRADVSKIVNKFNPKLLFGFIKTNLNQNQVLLN